MNNKLIINLCLLVPFVFTVLNLQVLVMLFFSETYAQIMAYLNLGLIILGIGLILKNKGELSRTARLWIIFYIMYFTFAILAGVIHGNPSNIVASTIPLFYTIGFFYYFSLPENIRLFEKIALIAFSISCILCIYFYKINFDLDKGGIHIYPVDRAQGVYGDANNMALMCIMAFIFTFKIYKPKKTLFKILKLALLFVIAYSLVITFSTTGLSVFVISLVVLNHNFFKGLKLVLGIILLPIVYVILLNLNTITADVNLVGQQRDKVTNLVNVVSFNFDEVDDSGRGDLASVVLDYIYENPFLGNGVEFGALNKVHNTFLGVWADAGIFSLIFFLFLLGAYFLRTVSCPKDIRFFIIPLLITTCIFMLSLHSVINQPYLMALFIYLGYLIDDKNREVI